MRKTATNILLLVSLSLCHGCGGIGFDYEEKLSGNFGLIACDARAQMSVGKILPSGSVDLVIGQTVFAVGWNAEFIIAKRHPSEGTEAAKINKSVTEFYILNVATEKLVGPLNEVEFWKQRSLLGVPGDLGFTRVFADVE